LCYINQRCRATWADLQDLLRDDEWHVLRDIPGGTNSQG
jgi:hypothetical protein